MTVELSRDEGKALLKQFAELPKSLDDLERKAKEDRRIQDIAGALDVVVIQLRRIARTQTIVCRHVK